MSRNITIDPITRIEGHARVEIDIDDEDNITHSIFKVMDFRGWEAFLRGMQVEMMPTITSRICGICSASHHLAAARTVDKVFEVTAPRPAWLIRNALNLAHFIHSHAVHLFVLTAPDLLPSLQADPARRNIMGLVDAFPKISTKALRLRSIGQMVTEIIGGRGTHPVSFMVGGLAAPLSRDKRDLMQKLADEGLKICIRLTEVARKIIFGKPMDPARSLPIETHYLGMVDDGVITHYQGNLRLLAPDGDAFDFPEDRWNAYLYEEAHDGSYAKPVLFRSPDGETVSFRVGPLARINCCDRIDTPLAQEKLEQLRALGGSPCHETVMYHYARIIELLHASEKLCRLIVDDELCSDNIRTVATSEPRNAAAVVEAPRGVLIHDYKVDANGIVTDANMLVATQMNLPAINRTVAMAAGQYLDQPDELLLNAIEFGIRCYDPCLSCATHRLGEMKMEAVIRRQGRIIRTVRR